MVHILVTMLITVKHYIQHKYLICAQIQYESINIITSLLVKDKQLNSHTDQNYIISKLFQLHFDLDL